VVKNICATLDALQPRKDGKKYESQIEFVTDRLGHDRRYAIDDAKSEAKLGFTRTHDFDSGLKSTIEWYLANTEWCKTVKEKKT
jgi:dTDP-glucose 4,6-dehydratase